MSLEFCWRIHFNLYAQNDSNIVAIVNLGNCRFYRMRMDAALGTLQVYSRNTYEKVNK